MGQPQRNVRSGSLRRKLANLAPADLARARRAGASAALAAAVAHRGRNRDSDAGDADASTGNARIETVGKSQS